MKNVDIIADAVEQRICEVLRIRKELANTGVDLCDYSDVQRSVHVSTGIRALAMDAGAPLEVRTYTEKNICLYFLYRGIEFFQLQRIE